MNLKYILWAGWDDDGLQSVVSSTIGLVSFSVKLTNIPINSLSKWPAREQKTLDSETKKWNINASRS